MIKRLQNLIEGKALRLPPLWQRLLDIYLFINVIVYFIWQSWQVFSEGRLNFIEAVFIVHNIIFCFCFIVRSPAKAISASLSGQMVAVLAFYTGLLFVGAEASTKPLLLDISWCLLLVGLIIGIAALLNLGKSFGVLIAVRKVKTAGLYSLVRHPMYLSDIVMRLGYLVSHPTPLVAALFTVSTLCYFWRAVLEERFITDMDPAYLDYMKKVRFRFIPGLI